MDWPSVEPTHLLVSSVEEEDTMRGCVDVKTMSSTSTRTIGTQTYESARKKSEKKVFVTVKEWSNFGNSVKKYGHIQF